MTDNFKGDVTFRAVPRSKLYGMGGMEQYYP